MVGKESIEITKHDRIIVHYDEIGIKGKNRITFEKILIGNINHKLKDLIKKSYRDFGQITIDLDGVTKEQEDQISKILSMIPGIAFFSFSKRVDLDIEKIRTEAINYCKPLDFQTFKVATKRHNKDFPMKSFDVNCQVGEAILESLDKTVKMKGFDLLVKVEISQKNAYISANDIKGVGGLPTDHRQKVVALLSGGFDSPVASYLMMKRGCEVTFIHFNNKNQESCSVKNKIIDLAKQLSNYQIKTKLYIIPFEKIQKEIIMKVRSEMRMLIYRKFMMKIGSLLAEKIGARFLVVGDSLSQVASQTLENLEATYHNTDKHVLSPVIGMHKKEIIAIAREIGTYDISKQPYGDCCSYFLPKHPMLRSNKELLSETLKNFDMDSLGKDALDNAIESEY